MGNNPDGIRFGRISSTALPNLTGDSNRFNRAAISVSTCRVSSGEAFGLSRELSLSCSAPTRRGDRRDLAGKGDLYPEAMVDATNIAEQIQIDIYIQPTSQLLVSAET